MSQTTSIGQSIRNLSNLIRRRLDASSSKAMIRGSQGRVLHYILAQTHDVYQKDIEEEFHLRPSTASGILKLMEKNELIQRVSLPSDNRLKRILITEKGESMKEQVMHDVQDMEDELVKGIDAEKLQLFLEVVQQMEKNLSA